MNLFYDPSNRGAEIRTVCSHACGRSLEPQAVRRDEPPFAGSVARR